MALMNCPECGHGVSNQAESCPNCGYVLNANNKNKKLELATYKGKNILNIVAGSLSLIAAIIFLVIGVIPTNPIFITISVIFFVSTIFCFGYFLYLRKQYK